MNRATSDHTFFAETSCRTCLSKPRSAISCFSCRFSSSSCFSRLSSPTPRPPYTFLHAVKRLLRNPHPPDDFGHRRAGFRLLQREGICSSVYRDFFISSSLPEGFRRPENSCSKLTKKQRGRQPLSGDLNHVRRFCAKVNGSAHFYRVHERRNLPQAVKSGLQSSW